MEYDTTGDQTNLQASSDSGREVKMIFPMAGESTQTDDSVVSPPQLFFLAPEPDEADCDSAEAASSDMAVETVDRGSHEENVKRSKDYCETHPDESVTTYCQTCNRLVCLECLVEDDTHVSHKKITIKKLLATPQFFAETSQGLSKLLGNKEQYLENLKHAAKNIELDHDSQLKAIRDMEKKALEKLNRGLEAETEKLKAASKKQKNQIKDVARFAVEAIERHLENQTSKNQAERAKVVTALPTLCGLAATMRKEPSADILYDLVAGYQRSEHILKNETGDLVVTGVETKAEKVDGKGMKKFTGLTVKVVDVAVNITDLRAHMKAIVPDCVTTYNKNNRKIGSVVICKEYFSICCNFGLHSSTQNLVPGCYKEPNFTVPVEVNDDLIFMDPTDAMSLSSLFGGKPSLTVKVSNIIWGLGNDEGVFVSYYCWITNKRKKRVTSDSTELAQRTGYAFLPSCYKLYNALEVYLGWRPSQVKCQKTKEEFDEMMTVEEWGRTAECRRIVVE